MPPTRGGGRGGRMGGPSSRGGRMGGSCTSRQTTIDEEFKSVKFHRVRRQKPKGRPPQKPESIAKQEGLLKLRIPYELCRTLPSMKLKNGGFVKKESHITSVSHPDSDSSQDGIKTEGGLGVVYGNKRKRGEQMKYKLQKVCEAKFPGMIWDVAICPSGDIIVCATEGALLCDSNLNRKMKLENVIFPGGISFLPDGRFCIVCRNTDTVNFFKPNGTFVKSFPAGSSPMAVAVNRDGELFVTDTSNKSVNLYDAQGKLLHTAPQTGEQYELKWPLYPVVTKENKCLVVDCHTQKVLMFDSKCNFLQPFSTATTPGSQLLRPHGIAENSDGHLFIVDTAIDTIDVFQPSGMFLQSLLPPEEGTSLKPKVIGIRDDHMVLGGLTGVVQIYKITDNSKESEVILLD